MIITFKGLYKDEVARLFTLLTCESDKLETESLSIDVVDVMGGCFDFSFELISSVGVNIRDSVVIVINHDSSIGISREDFECLQIK